MTETPTFKHHKTVLEAYANIFGDCVDSVTVDDPAIKEMLMTIPITRNGISALQGITGVGKSQLIYAFKNVMFGDDTLGIIKCDPNKSPLETLYGSNVTTTTEYEYDSNDKLIRTHETYEIEPDVLDFVRKPVKFINEANRAAKAVQDALLGLLQEKQLEYRGKIFKIPEPFICVLDMNPAFLQTADAVLEPALIDRIDITLEIPSTSLINDIEIQTNLSTGKKLTNLLTYREMSEVMDDVDKVQIPPQMFTIISIISHDIRGCKYKRDVANQMFLEAIDCDECQFKNGICNNIMYPVGHRHISSTIKIAKSLAWLDGESSISVRHMIKALPFTLGHRLTTRDTVKLEHENSYTWFYNTVLPGIKNRMSTYSQMVNEYQRARNGEKEAVITLIKMTSNNLIYRQLLKSLLHKTNKVLTDVISKFNDSLAQNNDLMELVDEYEIQRDQIKTIVDCFTNISKYTSDTSIYTLIDASHTLMINTMKSMIDDLESIILNLTDEADLIIRVHTSDINEYNDAIDTIVDFARSKKLEHELKNNPTGFTTVLKRAGITVTIAIEDEKYLIVVECHKQQIYDTLLSDLK